MVTVDTLLRLAGNLASAEKQYRECPVPQKARAWKIMEEAGDRIRDLIDGRRPAEASEPEQIPHPVAEAEQSPVTSLLLIVLEALETWLNARAMGRGEEELISVAIAAKKARAALAQAPTRNAGEAQ